MNPNVRPVGHFDTLEDRRRFVSDQYERLWSGVREKADAAIKIGETDLRRLHLATRRIFGADFSDPKFEQKYRHHETSKRESGVILDRQLLRIADLESQTFTFITDAIKMREVIRAIGEVDRIIETGAGWAKTLINIWLHGGPKDAEYWAFELTRSGRAVTEAILNAAASKPDLRTAFIDYYEPDFSIITGAKRTAVVTHHSIEQIPEIGRNYIDALLAIQGFHRCVHIEPVGWQISTQNWLSDPAHYEVMRDIDRRNRDFSLKRNQNRNLYPLLREYEQAGKIKIHVVRKHLCSHLIHNATTLIAWGPATDPTPVNALRRDDLQPDVARLLHVKPDIGRLPYLWAFARKILRRLRRIGG